MIESMCSYFVIQVVKSNSAGVPMVVQPPVPGLSSHAAPSFSYNLPQSGAAISSNQHAQSTTVS